jgi:hypothetical protein
MVCLFGVLETPLQPNRLFGNAVLKYYSFEIPYLQLHMT